MFVTVGEEDEFKHGEVVEVVECDSFEGVYFQYYNHKRYPAQPTKDEMEQTACALFPPWKKRGSDFVWGPEIDDVFEVFGYGDFEKIYIIRDASKSINIHFTEQ